MAIERSTEFEPKDPYADTGYVSSRPDPDEPPRGSRIQRKRQENVIALTPSSGPLSAKEVVNTTQVEPPVNVQLDLADVNKHLSEARQALASSIEYRTDHELDKAFDTAREVAAAQKIAYLHRQEFEAMMAPYEQADRQQ